MSTSLSTGELVPGTYAAQTIGKQFINSVSIQPGATITIYDSITAAGKVVFQFVNAGTSTVFVTADRPIRLDDGMSIVVAAANAQVYFGAVG